MGIRTRTSGIMIPAYVAAAAPYTGPGDVYGAATAWWGVRAYSAASIGQNAIQIVDNLGNNPTNITTVSGGGLDMTAVNNFIGTFGQPDVKIFYDQANPGSGFDLTVVDNRAQLTANVLSSFSGATFSISRYQSTNSACPTSQPYTASLVANVTSSATSVQNFLVSNSAIVQFVAYVSGPDRWYTYAGGAGGQNGSAALTTFHAGQALVSNSSANMYIDGTPNTGTVIGTGVMNASDGFMIGGIPDGSQLLIGHFMEAGVWASDKSSLFSNMNSNQHTFYSF